MPDEPHNESFSRLLRRALTGSKASSPQGGMGRGVHRPVTFELPDIVKVVKVAHLEFDR